MMKYLALLAVFGGLILAYCVDDAPSQSHAALSLANEETSLPQPVAAQPQSPPALPAPTWPPDAPDTGGYFSVAGTIDSNLYSAVTSSLDAHSPDETLLAEKLAAHLKRIFMFKIDFRKDLRPGDQFSIVFDFDDSRTDGLRILAARVEGTRHRKTFESFYFQGPGETFGRYYDRNGVTTQAEIVQGPMKDYEEITALLKDRRPRHNGIDIKAPVGTPVHLPFSGVVEARRADRRSGTYLVVRYDSKPYHAYFLHLDGYAEKAAVGRHLSSGEVIGYVGNTGRSYAPHLHYELRSSAGRVVNPLKVHGVAYPPLDEKHRAAFLDAIRPLVEQLDLARPVPAFETTASL